MSYNSASSKLFKIGSGTCVTQMVIITEYEVLFQSLNHLFIHSSIKWSYIVE